jgi:predicted nucleic acid-binding protein
MGFYLALAEAEQLPLVTADRRFLAKLTGTRWQDRSLALGQF